MQSTPNPSELGVEKGYPNRSALRGEHIDWQVSLPDSVDYGVPMTNLSPQCGSVVEKLGRQGLSVNGEEMIAELSRMGSEDVATHYGTEFASKLEGLRCPLGRTGLNGVGIFYEAGPSETADMLVFHRDDGGIWTPLVFTRNRWNTPGGFVDATDANIVDCALREFDEETGHDLSNDITGVMHVLSEVKASDRTVDHGWIQSNVYATEVDSRFSLDISKVSDTEEVKDIRWFNLTEIGNLVGANLLSVAKESYIKGAARLALD